MPADILDQASELTDAINEMAIETVRARAKPEQEPNLDGTWPITECTTCGEDIEPGRLELGKVRCFHCQTQLEARGKYFR